MNKQQAIHDNLANDLAYKWSREHDSVTNMQMVLRAYGYDYRYGAALDQLDFNRK